MTVRHPALLYGGTDEFLASMIPYVEAGLAEGATVFVAARADNVDSLREAIGDVPRVEYADTDVWHPHPAPRLRAFHIYINDLLASGVRSIRLAGEPVWPEGPPAFVREWQRYESALNAVLAPYPVSLVCLYDALRLDPALLAGARTTHPVLLQGTAALPSPSFAPPAELLPRWNPPLDPPPAGAASLEHPRDLPSARWFLAEQARAAGVTPMQAEDLAVALNEVVTNAMLHGGGASLVRAWTQDGYFVCQVDDDGPGIADPVAAYRPPGSRAEGGRGLWLALQMVDLLQVVPGERGGTSVRLHARTG